MKIKKKIKIILIQTRNSSSDIKVLVGRSIYQFLRFIFTTNNIREMSWNTLYLTCVCLIVENVRENQKTERFQKKKIKRQN